MFIRTARFAAAAALGAIGLLLSFEFARRSALWTAVSILAWIWLGLVAFELFAGIWKRIRRDKYDLRSLHEIDQKEQLKSIEDEPVIHGDNVLCPYCHNVYSSELPSCPACKKTLGT